MISLDTIRSKVTNCFIIIRFKQIPDLGMAFCVDLDDDGNMVGTTIWGVRNGREESFRLKTELSTEIFKIDLKFGKNNNELLMKMEPLHNTIRIRQKKSTGEFIALYPYAKEKVLGQIHHVDVSGQMEPLYMEFTVKSTYKSSKDGPVKELEETISAPYEFTKALHDMFA